MYTITNECLAYGHLNRRLVIRFSRPYALPRSEETLVIPFRNANRYALSYAEVDRFFLKTAKPVAQVTRVANPIIFICDTLCFFFFLFLLLQKRMDLYVMLTMYDTKKYK